MTDDLEIEIIRCVWSGPVTMNLLLKYLGKFGAK